MCLLYNITRRGLACVAYLYREAMREPDDRGRHGGMVSHVFFISTLFRLLTAEAGRAGRQKSLFKIMCIILGISCECLEAIASSVTAVATTCGVFYAVIQYCFYKKQEKTAILLKYNERYATDQNIQKVVNYLLWKIDHQKHGIPVNKVYYGFDNEEDIKPTKNQVEMFMRFFEELQISIEAKRLDPNMVKKLFAYYAHKLPQMIDNDLLPEEYVIEKDMPEPSQIENWDYCQRFLNQTAI